LEHVEGKGLDSEVILIRRDSLNGVKTSCQKKSQEAGREKT
jgi:hypothetical protein